MKKININIDNIKPEEIDLIVDYLYRGKVVILPTDTVYGLHADATNAKAVNKIYKIKKRDKKMPILTLVKSWCMVKKYTYFNKKQDKYMRTLWPGAVSAILNKRDNLAKNISPNNSVAVRMPDSEMFLKIIKKLNKPLVSTSLNISGNIQITNLENIDKIFKTKPDLIVDAGILKKKKPSKIIDIRDVDDVKVIRK